MCETTVINIMLDTTALVKNFKFEQVFKHIEGFVLAVV